ncbi:L,D-transpeptidase family protein [Psychrobacter sp. FDAARGOS_221]|uniref:L,D-transpeptidase family protein n=1 Tax=Psychrobacter sp. FDAARGOS_221 TaxID=1975705 RepID=UPI001D0D56FB|nr:L,D-transpeptidase family protein [Psychrobacter sp. FDAARGOS_221]
MINKTSKNNTLTTTTTNKTSYKNNQPHQSAYLTKLIMTGVASGMLAISSPVFAQQKNSTAKVDSAEVEDIQATASNDVDSVDRLQQLIEETEGVTEKTAAKKTPKTNDQQIEIESSEDGGQAVASKGLEIDEASIKSIENKDGKVYTTLSLSGYAKAVNSATWTPNMNPNTAMTVKLQALLDWNHASPGPLDGGWGMNSIKALTNFQKMSGLPATGSMDQATWDALTKNIDTNQPVLVKYTITKEDVNTTFAPTPSGSEAKSKVKGLYYENIEEMFGERFHMDIRYLKKLNKGKKFVEGETITVINTADPLKAKVDRVVANKADKTLYAYSGDMLVATYPTTVGSDTTPSPTGSFKIINKVKMPWYKSTVNKGTDKQQVFMLPPGPNNPVGVVWMGLSKPSYGIHGSPVPEGISRQGSAGCVRLTNWDVLELFANIEKGATVELK